MSALVVRQCKECGRMSWQIMRVPHIYSLFEIIGFELLLNECTKCPYCGGKTSKFMDVTKPIKKLTKEEKKETHT